MSASGSTAAFGWSPPPPMPVTLRPTDDIPDTSGGPAATEFAEMIANGAGPQRSAFLSAFFALVGCHGLHVAVGLVWLMVMMAQVALKGFRPPVLRRLQCFSLFWHALDIVWVGLFTVVYLMGVAS